VLNFTSKTSGAFSWIFFFKTRDVLMEGRFMELRIFFSMATPALEGLGGAAYRRSESSPDAAGQPAATQHDLLRLQLRRGGRGATGQRDGDMVTWW